MNRIICRCAIGFSSIALCSSVLAPSTAAAADLYRPLSGGTWADSQWVDSSSTPYVQPTAADTAYIGCDQAVAALVSTVTVSTANARVKTLYVGRSVANTTDNGEKGTLILADNASLTATNLYFGNVTATIGGRGSLQLGQNATVSVVKILGINNSDIRINGNQLSVGSDLQMGMAYNVSPYPNSKLTVDGGTLNVGGNFRFGNVLRQVMTLTLTNNATMNVGGHFPDLASGDNRDLTRTLIIYSGSKLNIAGDLVLVHADLTFPGDQVTVGGRLSLAPTQGGGAELSAMLTQAGGRLVANSLTVQESDYRVNLIRYLMNNNARLSLRRPASGNVENIIGKSGPDGAPVPGTDARLYLGTSTHPGTIDIDENGGSGTHSLTLNKYSRVGTATTKQNRHALLTGWGSVLLNGTLENNAKVIADGYGTDRDLFMTNFAAVVQNDTHANNVLFGFVLSDGIKPGWYAVNRGRLCLPRLTVAAGSSTIRWGDTVNDLTVNTNDLVNSMTLAFSGVNGGRVKSALMAADRTDSLVTDASKVIGIWQVDAAELDRGTGTATLAFRYDHLKAIALGLTEANLKVWRHRGDGWVDATAGIDTTQKIITTKPLRDMTLFAVATSIPGDEPPKGMMFMVR